MYLVATTVKEQIQGLTDGVDIFIAEDDIRAGRNYKTEIRNKLKSSEWLIMIYTGEGKDWEWPTFEAANFLGVHDYQETYDARLCCLHDTDQRPKPLSEFQSYKCSAFPRNPEDSDDTHKLKEIEYYKTSPSYKFLVNLLSYPEKNPTS